jgi:hypothetical protein
MIGPSSEFTKLSDQINLFDIRTTKKEARELLNLCSDLKKFLPPRSNFSLNFFWKGKEIQGEFIFGNLGLCVLSRQSASDLSDLSRKLKTDIIRKLNKRNSGNNWGGAHLSAV